jgi:hypothetical protein
MEDGSSLQPQLNTEQEESTAEFGPNIANASSESRSNHGPQRYRNSDDDGGVEELQSLYPNLFGIIPDPLFSYTDVSNPSTMGGSFSLSDSPTTAFPSKYRDRSSLLPVILENLPSKSDAIEMINSYYQQIAIEWVLSRSFSRTLAYQSR